MTFGAKGMTFHMTFSNGKPYSFWISYKGTSTSNNATDKKIGELYMSWD